jgi:chromosome segregation ATPase
MGELVKVVDSLENKISKLLHRMELLQQSNAQLENELDDLKKDKVEVSNSISVWEERYNSLKLSNTMLGSNTDKTEAKLKINTLIRELDHCIAQLAE